MSSPPTIAPSGSGGKLRPGDAWNRFDAGVRAVFEGWPALHLCQQNADRPEFARRACTEMIEDVVDWFQKDGEIWPDEIEAYLSQEIEETMNACIEDGTVGNIAEYLNKMFRQCVVGNFEMVQSAIQQVTASQTVVANATQQHVHQDEVMGPDDVMVDDIDDDAAPNLVPSAPQHNPGELLNALLAEIAQSVMTPAFLASGADHIGVLQAVQKDVEGRLVSLGVGPSGNSNNKKKKKSGKNTVEEGDDGWVTVK